MKRPSKGSTTAAPFTLRTYVHLMDEGVGDAAFMDRAVGNGCEAEDPVAPTASATRG